MKVDYQLDQSDLIAFSKEHRRFAPNSLSRVYYFIVLPALGVALAVTTDSFLLAMAFTVLYMLSGWGFQSLIRQRYYQAIFSNENLAFAAGPWQATLSQEGATFSPINAPVATSPPAPVCALRQSQLASSAPLEVTLPLCQNRGQKRFF